MLGHMTRHAQFRLAIGGLIALASGMGLGRFLYTPVLPMMVEGAGLRVTVDTENGSFDQEFSLYPHWIGSIQCFLQQIQQSWFAFHLPEHLYCMHSCGDCFLFT